MCAAKLYVVEQHLGNGDWYPMHDKPVPARQVRAIRSRVAVATRAREATEIEISTAEVLH